MCETVKDCFDCLLAFVFVGGFFVLSLWRFFVPEPEVRNEKKNKPERKGLKPVFLILFFPVIPFLIARKIRKDRPVQSRLISLLYGTLYILITFAALMNAFTA